MVWYGLPGTRCLVYSMVWYGLARHVMVWCGTVSEKESETKGATTKWVGLYIEVRKNNCSTAQDRTVQYSIAHHSIAQHTIV